MGLGPLSSHAPIRASQPCSERAHAPRRRFGRVDDIGGGEAQRGAKDAWLAWLSVVGRGVSRSISWRLSWLEWQWGEVEKANIEAECQDHSMSNRLYPTVPRDLHSAGAMVQGQNPLQIPNTRCLDFSSHPKNPGPSTGKGLVQVRTPAIASSTPAMESPFLRTLSGPALLDGFSWSGRRRLSRKEEAKPEEAKPGEKRKARWRRPGKATQRVPGGGGEPSRNQKKGVRWNPGSKAMKHLAFRNTYGIQMYTTRLQWSPGASSDCFDLQILWIQVSLHRSDRVGRSGGTTTAPLDSTGLEEVPIS